LVVEDDPELRAVVANIFHGFQCQVIEAACGATAFELACRHQPDIVLMDFELPDFNGYQLIHRMRQSDALLPIPVIMLTGSPRAFTLAENLEWEVSALLRKPARPKEVIDTVSAILGGRLPLRREDMPPIPSVPVPPPAIAPPPPAPDHASELQDLLASNAKDSCEIEPEEPQSSDVHDIGADAAPVIRLVNTVMSLAVDKKTSDIHLEPQENAIRVRLRVDGRLLPQLEIPRNMGPAITARIKVMASLDIAEKRMPQDGRFRMRLSGGRKVDVRVSTLPSKYGEKVVMRLLGQSSISGDLSQLKMHVRDRQCLETALGNPSGLILATGPTGSGKTTTLYTMLAALNTPERNIVTVEDPIEYDLPGITQVAVRNEAGVTFERTLRAFLRQDPDVILVGEIRDAETAEIALKAAVTGHLVLSTLHTNDAVASVSRLINMGVPSYMVAAAVRLVVAQRLVRVLCPHCKTLGAPPDAEKRLLSNDEAARLTAAYTAVGCPKCDGIGYRGRAPVMEILPVTSAAMRELISRGCPQDTLLSLALTEGLRPLRWAALRLVEAGETSLSEALKIMVSE
jgi:type IV pilus assembly protein PilB